MTFDVGNELVFQYLWDWQRWYEVYSVCRNCRRSTVFIVAQQAPDKSLAEKGALVNYGRSLNEFMTVESYVSHRHEAQSSPPDHVPDDIREAFIEGSTCLSVQCFNAAGAMFRLCVDLATRRLLPADEREGLNAKVRRDLGLRLPWLFKNSLLPEALADLSACIREDGNDGAHVGNLAKEDAEDLKDFTVALLERLFTEPARLQLAKERRDNRRAGR